MPTGSVFITLIPMLLGGSRLKHNFYFPPSASTPFPRPLIYASIQTFYSQTLFSGAENGLSPVDKGEQWAYSGISFIGNPHGEQAPSCDSLLDRVICLVVCFFEGELRKSL